MKLRVYTRFIDVTSFVLNICVKNKWWVIAKSLIEFRKKHIAKTVRKELVAFS